LPHPFTQRRVAPRLSILLAVLATLIVPAAAGAAPGPDGSYAATTKRCTLWSIRSHERTFTPLVDVPGVGDTCYPSIIRQTKGRFLVYNYTSPLDGSDPPWGTALTAGDTLIYRMTLRFLDG
jgi:hypothetical protein